MYIGQWRHLTEGVKFPLTKLLLDNWEQPNQGYLDWLLEEGLRLYESVLKVKLGRHEWE